MNLPAMNDYRVSPVYEGDERASREKLGYFVRAESTQAAERVIRNRRPDVPNWEIEEWPTGLEPTVMLEYYSDVDIPCSVESYYGCIKCYKELPRNQTMEEWSKLSVGVSADGGLQVWCRRHSCNVVKISLGVGDPGFEDKAFEA